MPGTPLLKGRKPLKRDSDLSGRAHLIITTRLMNARSDNPDCTQEVRRLLDIVEELFKDSNFRVIADSWIRPAIFDENMNHFPAFLISFNEKVLKKFDEEYGFKQEFLDFLHTRHNSINSGMEK